MNFLIIVYIALLFVLLTPSVLIKLPPKGSPLTVAIVHGLVFALVFYFTYRHVYRLTTNEAFVAEDEAIVAKTGFDMSFSVPIPTLAGLGKLLPSTKSLKDLSKSDE